MATGDSSVQVRDATDEDVLEAPGEFTVDEVLGVFARSTPLQIAATKMLESEGKDRNGIAEYEPPAPDRQASSDEPAFTRERLLGREGETIAGYQHPVIVGALHEADGDEFTRPEIQALAEAFLARPVEEA